MAFFTLKLEKGILYLYSKASLSSYGLFLGQPIGHKCNTLSAKSRNIFSSLMFGSHTNCQIPHLLRLCVKFPTPSAVPKVKCPTPGGREGVKCPWYAQGGCQGYKLIGTLLGQIHQNFQEINDTWPQHLFIVPTDFSQTCIRLVSDMIFQHLLPCMVCILHQQFWQSSRLTDH